MRARFAVVTAVVALAGAAACKIDPTVYVRPGSDDGDGGMTDASVDAPPVTGPRVLVTPDTTTVAEGGQTTVRVSLSSAPAADVSITVDPIDDMRLASSPGGLTFTTSNWNVERIVTLMAAPDDDASDNPVTVVFSGGGSVGDGAATVMVTDNDLMRVILTPPGALTVSEGQTAPIQARLSARPSSPVTVTVAPMSPSIVSLDTSTLTFTTSNWNANQPVTVTGTEDVNTMDDTVQVVFDPATEGIGTESVVVTVSDNDVLNIEATPGSLGSINEGGVSSSFMVRLTQMPASSVTVNLQAAPAGAVTVQPTSLTFTTSNWGNAQPVTVTAIEDANVASENVTITLTANGLTSREVTATVIDNDTQAILVNPSQITNLVEGTTRDIDVRLAFQPAAATTVTVTSLDPSLVGVNLTELTFTPQNYAAVQTVRAGAVDDVNLTGGSTTVRFNAAAEGITRDVPVAVTDDDTQAIVVDRAYLAITEGGADTINVKLAFQPSANVSVTVASDNPNKIGASPMTLTFTPQSYATPQAVTVSGIEDIDLANESGNVAFSATGVANASVPVAVADNDAQDIVVSPSPLTVTEGGSSTLMVRLGAQPSGQVTVTIASNPPGAVGLSPSQLTFTTSNWSTNQGVTVSAPEDVDASNESATLTLSANGLNDKSVPVTIQDNDTLTAQVSPDPFYITEGELALAYVHLSHDPGTTVNVSVSVVASNQIEVSPQTLTFNSSDWMTDQPLTISAPFDDDNLGGAITVRLSVPGGATTDLIVHLTDPTIVVGFPPPFGPGPRAVGTYLHAFQAEPPDATTFGCFYIEKIVVEVASVGTSIMPAVRVGLYSDNVNTGPSSLLFSDQPRSVVVGRNTFAIGREVSLSWPLWVAVQGSPMVSLATKVEPVKHCYRFHNFGDNMPNPFESAFGGGGGSGSGSGSGTVTVTCDDDRPMAVWFIGYYTRTICGIDQ